MLTQIAWRNLWRNKRRTVLTALTMGLGVAFCIWMASYMGGFMKVMRGATVDRNIGHIQINHQDYPETQNPYDVVPKAKTALDTVTTAGQPPLRARGSRVGPLAGQLSWALLGSKAP